MGCQMAIARFLDRMPWPFGLEGLWLRYATLQNLIPSLPWIVPPHAIHPGTIQGKEGIKLYHLATLAAGRRGVCEIARRAADGVSDSGGGHPGDRRALCHQVVF